MRSALPRRPGRSIQIRRLWWRAPVLDFLPARPRARWLGWALLAAVLASATVLAVEWLGLRDDLQVQSRRLEQWQGHLRPAAPVSARADGVAGGSAPEAARAAAVQVSQAMRYPWPAIMTAVDESTPPGVQWLRLEHDRTRSDLRLEGVAPNAGTALRVVDALAVRPGWRSVVLTRLGGKAGAASAASAAQAAPAGLPFEIRCEIDVSALPAGGV